MSIRIVSYTLEQVRAIPDIRALPYYPGLQRTGNYQRTRDDFAHPIGGVQHIAVTPEDNDGVDSSAEAVTRYGVNLSNTRASWNDCVDRDSYCPLLPPTVRPWQHGIAGMGVDMNEAGIGQEMGAFGTNWDGKDARWVTEMLQMSAAVWAAWFTAYDWPLKVTLNRTRLFELARRGESWGLTSHAVIDPANRSDPGVYRGVDTFPWDRLLGLIHDEMTIRTGGGVLPKPKPPEPTVPEWQTPEHVRAVQQLLIDVTAADLVVDGIRGPATEAATLHYQTEYRTDLDHDGSPGPATLTALEADMSAITDLTDKLDKIPEAVLGRIVPKPGSRENTTRIDTFIRYGATGAQVAALTAQTAALTAAVEALASTKGIDPEVIAAAIREAVEKSTADMRIILTTTQED